ncbi:Aste57867_11274 [Aphanomyces stellatus]|uniref:Aste57867_11274 protein n=1 Tax=Aphanomyces stellatus TaxID=120398 RepID=A0A485KSH0_9STRA|nr:hypothetical protein As57867_011232 [Aphanomyces stellatus]VFT88137.1 Aste57867_11274 [Aphanomyces stellatus]
MHDVVPVVADAASIVIGDLARERVELALISRSASLATEKKIPGQVTAMRIWPVKELNKTRDQRSVSCVDRRIVGGTRHVHPANAERDIESEACGQNHKERFAIAKRALLHCVLYGSRLHPYGANKYPVVCLSMWHRSHHTAGRPLKRLAQNTDCSPLRLLAGDPTFASAPTLPNSPPLAIVTLVVPRRANVHCRDLLTCACLKYPCVHHVVDVAA